jgi:hypothetical protein
MGKIYHNFNDTVFMESAWRPIFSDGQHNDIYVCPECCPDYLESSFELDLHRYPKDWQMAALIAWKN